MITVIPLSSSSSLVPLGFCENTIVFLVKITGFISIILIYASNPSELLFLLAQYSDDEHSNTDEENVHHEEEHYSDCRTSPNYVSENGSSTKFKAYGIRQRLSEKEAERRAKIASDSSGNPNSMSTLLHSGPQLPYRHLRLHLHFE